MDEPRGPNPFVPGWGRTPPYLAGRRAEQRRLLDLFAYLRHGEGAPRGAILSGPAATARQLLCDGSITRSTSVSLAPRYGDGPWTREKFAEKHILFQEDRGTGEYDYIAAIFGSEAA